MFWTAGHAAHLTHACALVERLLQLVAKVLASNGQNRPESSQLCFLCAIKTGLVIVGPEPCSSKRVGKCCKKRVEQRSCKRQ